MNRVLMGFGRQAELMSWSRKSLKGWWAWQNSNLRPLPCQGRIRQQLTASAVDSKRHLVFDSGSSGFYLRLLGAIGF